MIKPLPWVIYRKIIVSWIAQFRPAQKVEKVVLHFGGCKVNTYEVVNRVSQCNVTCLTCKVGLSGDLEQLMQLALEY